MILSKAGNDDSQAYFLFFELLEEFQKEKKLRNDSLKVSKQATSQVKPIDPVSARNR
jgi:hypothetical protein